MPRIKRRWGPGSALSVDVSSVASRGGGDSCNIPSTVRKVKQSSNDAKRIEVREPRGTVRRDEKKETKKKVDLEKKKIVPAKTFTFESFIFDISGVGRSGKILSCSGKTSLLRKKWKECFWVHLCPAILVVFSTVDDFRLWRKTAHDDPSRDKFLMWYINFDSMGFLEKKLKKLLKKEGAQLGIDKSVKIESKKNNDCPASSVSKYNMMDVLSNNKKGSTLYSFKLERWSQMGTETVASFASADPQEIKALRKVIKTSLEIASKPPKKSKKKDVGSSGTVTTLPSSSA